MERSINLFMFAYDCRCQVVKEKARYWIAHCLCVWVGGEYHQSPGPLFIPDKESYIKKRTPEAEGNYQKNAKEHNPYLYKVI